VNLIAGFETNNNEGQVPDHKEERPPSLNVCSKPAKKLFNSLN